jgi:hypothetical protein
MEPMVYCCLSHRGAGGKERVIPGLAIATDQGVFQEFHELHLLFSAALSSPRAFFNLHVAEKIAPHGMDTDREQVARNRLAPGDLAFLPGPLEAAFCYAVFEVNEDAFLLVHTRGGVVTRPAVHEARHLNRLDALLAEILLDDRVGPFYLPDFVVFEWSTPSAGEAAAGAFAGAKVSTKCDVTDGVIDDRLADNEHTCSLRHDDQV